MATERLQRGTSRGVMDPQWFFKNFSLRCYSPSSQLAPFVEHFWVIRWDPQHLPSPSYDYILTRPAITMSFSKHRPYIRGIVTEKILFTLAGDGVEVGVKFTPGGLYAFWEHDMSKLTHREVLVNAAFPEVTDDFFEKLYSKDDDTRFIDVMEKLLLNHPVHIDKNLQLIQRIVQAIHDNNYMTVAQVAARFKVSERTLHYLFAKRVGVGVKWLLMRPRLLEAVRNAHLLVKPDWTRIAADLGYSTQSHFVNDFKKYIGVAPSRYIHAIDRSGHMPTL